MQIPSKNCTQEKLALSMDQQEIIEIIKLLMLDGNNISSNFHIVKFLSNFVTTETQVLCFVQNCSVFGLVFSYINFHENRLIFTQKLVEYESKFAKKFALSRNPEKLLN